jgi:hypothetical protein
MTIIHEVFAQCHCLIGCKDIPIPQAGITMAKFSTSPVAIARMIISFQSSNIDSMHHLRLEHSVDGSHFQQASISTETLSADSFQASLRKKENI